MARYEAQTITEKILITRFALRAYAQESGEVLLSKEVHVHALALFGFMVRKKHSINFVSLLNSLRAMGRTHNRTGLYTLINKHVEAGYLIRGGGKGSVYYLTDKGNKVLNDVNQYLMNATPRVRKKDSIVMTGKPGPPKFRAQPVRWPPGKPGTRCKAPIIADTTPRDEPTATEHEPFPPFI